MSRVYGYYTVIKDSCRDEETLCFVCAVRRAVTQDHVRIKFETSDYEFNKCADCKDYIEDQVEI